MFDFRYHALSLAAVFLALVVGLLLGVAIGDRELVSSARQDLEASLRGDVREARREAGDLRGQLAERTRFEDAAYPLLVGGELEGRRIGLVFLGNGSEEIADLVRQALRDTGAQLALVGILEEPPDLAELAGRAEGTRYEELPRDAELVEPFGHRIGVQLVLGGQLVRRERATLMRSFNGTLEGGLDGVVVVRPPGDRQASTEALELGMVRGFAATERPVVGIELSTTEPSQVDWYRDREISSVDSLDEIAGRAALVFALAGAEGAWGTKATADALLPKLAGG